MSAPLGERLRRHRLVAGLTLESLSAASGISDRTISNIERGFSTTPQRRTLSALLDALALSEEEHQDLLRLARMPRVGSGSSQQSAVLAPHYVTDFTGRPTVMDEIAGFLLESDTRTQAPVLIVCGPAGVGKTTVALEALRRHVQSGCKRAFVDLNGMNALPLSPLRVMQALIAQTSDIRTVSTLDEAITQWQGIAEKDRVAVVLDNAATEEQIRPVLTAVPDAAVIVTSRRSLSGLADVQRITLSPLERAESVSLLGRIIPGQQRSDHDTDLLAAACGDLPLALRIAGNRIAAQPRSTVSDFVDKMASRQDPLRALIAGDLAVESTLQLSYDQTEPATRRLFRTLSLIDGATFDSQLAAAPWEEDPDDTGDRLDELTDLGLLEARGGNRYHLHDLVRLFSATLLRREKTDTTTARQRLRHWVLTAARNAGYWFEPDQNPTKISSGRGFVDSAAARSWLIVEASQWISAIQQAYALGEDQIVLDTADALHWFSDTWPAWDIWRILFTTSAKAATRSQDARQIAIHHGYACWLHLVQNEFQEALTFAESAVTASTTIDDPKEQGWALFYRAWSQGRLRDFDAAVRDAADAMELLTIAEDQDGIDQVLALTANMISLSGKPQEAVQYYQEILERLASRQDQVSTNILLVTTVSTKTMLARILTNIGDPTYALEQIPGVLRESEQNHYLDGISRSHLELARAAHLVGDEEGFTQHISVAKQIVIDQNIAVLIPQIEQLTGPET